MGYIWNLSTNQPKPPPSRHYLYIKRTFQYQHGKYQLDITLSLQRSPKMGPHHVANSYTNPIISGFNADPSIIRVNRDFFLVTSSFEYFPGVPIYHSTDLVNWKLIGHAVTRTSQLQIHTPEPGGGVWAATLRFHDGFFYVVAASFEHYRPQNDDRVWPLGFYVKTNNIWDSTSWSDPVYFDQVGFDQDVGGSVFFNQKYKKDKN
jgi:beta-xylosidase